MTHPDSHPKGYVSSPALLIGVLKRQQELKPTELHSRAEGTAPQVGTMLQSHVLHTPGPLLLCSQSALGTQMSYGATLCSTPTAPGGVQRTPKPCTSNDFPSSGFKSCF